MTNAVLVTGGRGFLGSRFVEELRSNGISVVAPARADLDLLDPGAVESTIRQNEVDTVVHLAACLDRREMPEARESQWQDTFMAGRVVLDAAVASGVSRLVMAGSMDEVGVVDGFIGPNVASQPSTTYGLCKSLLLQACRFVVERADTEVEIEWFRPTAIYGPGQGPGPMLVPGAFQSGLSGKPVQFTSGEQKRDFIFVDDVVDWMVRAVRLQLVSRGVNVHHVGTGNPIAVAEVLSRIEALTGGKFELGAIPRRAGEPDLFSVPVFDDPRSPLNEWVAKISIEEGLERTFSWWQHSVAAQPRLEAKNGDLPNCAGVPDLQ